MTRHSGCCIANMDLCFCREPSSAQFLLESFQSPLEGFQSSKFVAGDVKYQCVKFVTLVSGMTQYGFLGKGSALTSSFMSASLESLRLIKGAHAWNILCFLLKAAANQNVLFEGPLDC